MNKSEYQEKCEQLLNDEKTCKKLKGDPTRKYKMKLGNVLMDWKDRKIITPELHRSLLLTSPHVSTASLKYTPSGVKSEYVNSYIPTHTPEEY